MGGGSRRQSLASSRAPVGEGSHFQEAERGSSASSGTSSGTSSGASAEGSSADGAWSVGNAFRDFLNYKKTRFFKTREGARISSRGEGAQKEESGTAAPFPGQVEWVRRKTRTSQPTTQDRMVDNEATTRTHREDVSPPPREVDLHGIPPLNPRRQTLGDGPAPTSSKLPTTSLKFSSPFAGPTTGFSAAVSAFSAAKREKNAAKKFLRSGPPRPAPPPSPSSPASILKSTPSSLKSSKSSPRSSPSSSRSVRVVPPTSHDATTPTGLSRSVSSPTKTKPLDDCVEVSAENEMVPRRGLARDCIFEEKVRAALQKQNSSTGWPRPGRPSAGRRSAVPQCAAVSSSGPGAAPSPRSWRSGVSSGGSSPASARQVQLEASALPASRGGSSPRNRPTTLHTNSTDESAFEGHHFHSLRHLNGINSEEWSTSHRDDESSSSFSDGAEQQQVLSLGAGRTTPFDDDHDVDGCSSSFSESSLPSSLPSGVFTSSPSSPRGSSSSEGSEEDDLSSEAVDQDFVVLPCFQQTQPAQEVMRGGRGGISGEDPRRSEPRSRNDNESHHAGALLLSEGHHTAIFGMGKKNAEKEKSQKDARPVGEPIHLHQVRTQVQSSQ